MASRVSNLLKIYGRHNYDPGAHLYHAKDGAGPDGVYGKEKRHKVRKALYKMRLRATGMTDDILGSKEVGGRFENDFEQSPRS